MATETESSEVERLRQELGREHDLYLRALADFDNFRRRTERDRAAAAQRDRRAYLLSMLDLLDGFDLAVEHLDEAPESIAEGIRVLQRQLVGMLEAQGVRPFKSIGEPFNPEMHEAIGSEESEKFETGTVTHEARRGYRLGEELLRPARVRVAR
jgi:molecular chaperone GrpE